MSMAVKHLLTVLLAGLVASITACSKADEEGPIAFRDFQVNRLLTKGDIKIWDLTERSVNGEQQPLSECELDDFIRFDRNVLTEGDSNTLYMEPGELACTDLAVANLRGEWLAVEGEVIGVTTPVADTLEWYLYRTDSETALTPFTDTVQVFLEEISAEFLIIQYQEPLADGTEQLIRASYQAREL